MLTTLEDVEHYVWGSNCDGWHLLKSEGLSIIYERMPGGTQEARHRHNRAQQFFFVLNGTATFELEGKELVLSERQGVHVPAGKAHQMFNRSNEELIFMVISHPPSHGDRVNA
jgi:mannose-6-phosphate isomerase-like protein (cupin superfamily)